MVKCNDCIYWVETHEACGVRWGVCRRYPPVPVSGFPSITSGKWCGEAKERTCAFCGMSWHPAEVCGAVREQAEGQ